MNYSRFLPAFVLAAAFCLPVFAPGAAQAREIKLGHGFATAHPIHKALQQFSDEVREKTKGDLVFTLIPNGVLGGEMEMAQQLLAGMLEASFIGGVNGLQGYVPQAAIEDLPFLFKDAAAAHAAYDGAYGTRLREKYLEPLGIKVVDFIEHGFRQVTNNIRPITRPEDLKGLKLRVPPLDVRIEAFKLFGANPVPIALPELFSALQQGAVDGQENPIATIDSFKFYEVQKYMTLINHTYTSGLLMIHKGVWEKFSPEYRQIILTAGANAKKASRELSQQYEAEALARIGQTSGMQINTADYESFASVVKPLWDNFAKKNGTDLLNLLR